MQMTDSFATAIAVTIPILALAAGGEARSIRERIQKPHEQWEQFYQQHQQQHPLDLEGSADGVLEHLLGLPKLPLHFRVERAIAVLGAFVWLAVFSVLAVVELLTLRWLADGEPSGHGALAAFTLWSIGVGFLALIVAPMAYLAMPVMLLFDMVPAGLRRSLTEQAGSGKGGQVAKELAKETGGAFQRLTDRLAEENPGKKNITLGPRRLVKLLKQELAEPRNGQSPTRDVDHTLEPESDGTDSDK
jgi:hypothetical protein